MFLKIAVVNNSGNMGKSTICETMLQPRLEGSELIKIETLNSDGTNDEKFSANEFVEIFQKIDQADCAIVDVGSSNIEKFTLQLHAYKNSQEDFDWWIIPVIPKEKQQIDTIATIENLLDLGVETDRIKIVFNMYDETKSFDKQFSVILNSKTYKSLKLKGTPWIPETQVFSHLANIDKTFKEVTNDERNFRDLLRAAASPEERAQISEMRSVKRLVDGMNETLNTAFQQLNII